MTRLLLVVALVAAVLAPCALADTRSSFNRGRLEFWNSSSPYERMLPIAPICFYDDFLTATTSIPTSTTTTTGVVWISKIVGAAPPTVAGGADAAGGTVVCSLTTDSQKQDALLYQGDQRMFKLTNGVVFEASVTVTTLCTDNAIAYVGLAGDWTDGPNSITYSVWFQWDSTGAVYCGCDDNSADQNVTAATTVAEGSSYTFRIDCSDVSDIKYFIDGVPVASSTTFDYVATGANATLQPVIGLYKASGTGAGVLTVDHVRIWSNR